MIEVVFRKKGGPELAKIDIYNEGNGEYTALIGVEHGRGVGLYTRTITAFPRERYNVLALVFQVLRSLNDEDCLLLDKFLPDEPKGLRSGGFFNRR